MSMIERKGMIPAASMLGGADSSDERSVFDKRSVGGITDFSSILDGALQPSPPQGGARLVEKSRSLSANKSVSADLFPGRERISFDEQRKVSGGENRRTASAPDKATVKAAVRAAIVAANTEAAQEVDNEPSEVREARGARETQEFSRMRRDSLSLKEDEAEVPVSMADMMTAPLLAQAALILQANQNQLSSDGQPALLNGKNEINIVALPNLQAGHVTSILTGDGKPLFHIVENETNDIPIDMPIDMPIELLQNSKGNDDFILSLLQQSEQNRTGVLAEEAGLPLVAKLSANSNEECVLPDVQLQSLFPMQNAFVDKPTAEPLPKNWTEVPIGSLQVNKQQSTPLDLERAAILSHLTNQFDKMKIEFNVENPSVRASSVLQNLMQTEAASKNFGLVQAPNGQSMLASLQSQVVNMQQVPQIDSSIQLAALLNPTQKILETNLTSSLEPSVLLPNEATTWRLADQINREVNKDLVGSAPLLATPGVIFQETNRDFSGSMGEGSRDSMGGQKQSEVPFGEPLLRSDAAQQFRVPERTNTSAIASDRASTSPKEAAESDSIVRSTNQRIRQSLSELQRAGGGTSKIQITDSKMGQLDLQIKMGSENRVFVEIHTSNDGVRKSLENHVEDLRKSLQNQRLELAEVKIVHTPENARNDTDSRSGGQQPSQQQGQHAFAQGNPFADSGNQGRQQSGAYERGSPFADDVMQSSQRSRAGSAKRPQTNVQRTANGSLKVLA